MTTDQNHRCYQCHSVAAIEPSVQARFVCAVCGAVRIPIEDEGITPSSEQLDLLARATAARSAETVWRLVAIIVGAFAVISALVLWLAITFARPPVVVSVVAGLAVLAPFAFAGWAWRQSRDRAAEFQPAFDKAWVAAATDLSRARGKLDASTLAKLTRISEHDADQLLARMSAAKPLPATS